MRSAIVSAYRDSGSSPNPAEPPAWLPCPQLPFLTLAADLYCARFEEKGRADAAPLASHPDRDRNRRARYRDRDRRRDPHRTDLGEAGALRRGMAAADREVSGHAWAKVNT